MKLRLSDKLKASIESSAASAGRSLNAEIVARLEASFADQTPTPMHEHALRAFALRQLVDVVAAGVEEKRRVVPKDPTIDVDLLAIDLLKGQIAQAERLAVASATTKASRKK